MSRRFAQPWGRFLSFLALHILFVAVAAYQALSDDFLRNLTLNEADFDISNGGLLAPILIPRVPGTPGQVKAQEHLAGFFRTELPKWQLIWQNSTSTTPATGKKQMPFANLIARREPPWTKPGQANYLTLVAHYDSKMKPDGFIGATDSAVPCAILLHVARFVDEYMQRMHDEMIALGELGGTVPMDMGVQILLLDGEEAFVSWTATDSLYGARSLAAEWESTMNPAMSPYKDPLEQISMFVLLDLLGTASPNVPSYFQTTHWAYQGMASVEQRMRNLGLLETHPSTPFLSEADKKPNQFSRGGVQDDHIPFITRGVDTLHLIPSPFPVGIWHTMNDDGAHLDLPTVRDWAKIVTGFTMEWLDMMELVSE
ncbi:putative Glutaminyl-peptide cyclotransferase [Seiridium cardinale]|uniref:Peptide hydrolase n=1 Tax=Seiridium cardinale TaxID=138064 RepID=A0ABR2XMC8_9PEZI